VYFAIGNVLVSSRLGKLGFINTRWRKKDRRFKYIERLAAIRLGSLVPGIFVLLFILVWPPFVVVLLNHWLVWPNLFPSLKHLLPGVLSPWIVAWSVISLNCCFELSHWFVAWGLTSWIYAKTNWEFIPLKRQIFKVKCTCGILN